MSCAFLADVDLLVCGFFGVGFCGVGFSADTTFFWRFGFGFVLCAFVRVSFSMFCEAERTIINFFELIIKEITVVRYTVACLTMHGRWTDCGDA